MNRPPRNLLELGNFNQLSLSGTATEIFWKSHRRFAVRPSVKTPPPPLLKFDH
jgi:hypothetical protein